MAHSPLRIGVISLFLVLACSTSSGGSTDAATTLPDANGGGQANSGNAGDGEEAGANAGGANDANGGNSGSPGDGGNSGSADASSNGDASAAKVDCDPRRIFCKIAETPCPEGEVHEVINNCYGPCVKITACPCDEPADCPHDETYTCWNNTKHCNYYGP